MVDYLNTKGRKRHRRIPSPPKQFTSCDCEKQEYATEHHRVRPVLQCEKCFRVVQRGVRSGFPICYFCKLLTWAYFLKTRIISTTLRKIVLSHPTATVVVACDSIKVRPLLGIRDALRAFCVAHAHSRFVSSSAVLMRCSGRTVKHLETPSETAECDTGEVFNLFSIGNNAHHPLLPKKPVAPLPVQIESLGIVIRCVTLQDHKALRLFLSRCRHWVLRRSLVANLQPFVRYIG